MRRILIISASVIAFLGIVVGVYFFFFAGNADLIVAPQDNAGTLPEAGTTPIEPIDNETQIVDITQPQQVAPRLIQITTEAVVDGVVAFVASSTDPALGSVVRYVARRSGNVYEYNVGQNSLTRISNKTLPGIQEARWKRDGSIAYVRYLSGAGQETINTYALPADGEGGYFLAQDIVDLSVGETNIFSLASGNNGSVGTVSAFDGSQPRDVFTTPLSQLRASFLGSGQYLAFTKPAGSLPGYAYLVTSTGFERLAGPLHGLAALPSPSGDSVLISYTTNGILRLALLDVSSRALTQLPVATIADKCAWASDDSALYCGIPVSPPANASYPDDWYQGVVHFSDRLWRIDVEGRFAELVLDFGKEVGESLDAISLATDPAGSVLVFRNKNDASLWSYEL